MFGKLFLLTLVLLAFTTPMMAADGGMVITGAFSMAIAA